MVRRISLGGGYVCTATGGRLCSASSGCVVCNMSGCLGKGLRLSCLGRNRDVLIVSGNGILLSSPCRFSGVCDVRLLR